jgi:hypothetical protein
MLSVRIGGRLLWPAPSSPNGQLNANSGIGRKPQGQVRNALSAFSFEVEAFPTLAMLREIIFGIYRDIWASCTRASDRKISQPDG